MSNDDRLQELLDKKDIEEVVLRYCRGIDRMDRELVRSCYHADASDSHGTFSGNVDEFIDWVWQLLERNEISFHFVGNMLIELEDASLARSETYGVSIHRRQSKEPRHNLSTGFRYIDRFERRDGGPWRIARRVATTEWVRVEDPELQWPIGAGMLTGSRDRSDPVYAPLRDA